MFHNLRDSENLYNTAKGLSDDASAKLFSFSLPVEALREKRASAEIDREWKRAAVEAALHKVSQSTEFQYMVMQNWHANIQKKSSKPIYSLTNILYS